MSQHWNSLRKNSSDVLAYFIRALKQLLCLFCRKMAATVGSWSTTASSWMLVFVSPLCYLTRSSCNVAQFALYMLTASKWQLLSCLICSLQTDCE
jgi:hypothetical protein